MTADDVPNPYSRITLFRRSRPRSIDEIAAEVHAFLDATAGLHSHLRRWFTRDYGFRTQRCITREDCARFLRDAKIEWDGGVVLRGMPTYRITFSNERDGRDLVAFSLLFALEEDAASTWTGLRASMQIGACLLDLGAAGPTLVRGIFTHAVRTFAPAWGFAGSATVPDLRWDEATQAEAGWLTYLSRAANTAPFGGDGGAPEGVAPSPSPPAEVVSLDGRGWIVAAFPDLMRDDEPKHAQLLAKVRRELGARVRQDELDAPLLGPVAPIGSHDEGESRWARWAGSTAGMGATNEIDLVALQRGMLPFGKGIPPAPGTAPDAPRVHAEPKSRQPSAQGLSETGELDVAALQRGMLPFMRGTQSAQEAASTEASTRAEPEPIRPGALGVAETGEIDLAALHRAMFPFPKGSHPQPSTKAEPTDPPAASKAGPPTLQLPASFGPGETSGRATMELPAVAATPPPSLELEQYAALCAELAVHPDRKEAIFQRYRLSGAEARRALNDAFMRRFQDDRALHQRWQALVTHYSEWYRRQGKE